MAQRSAALASPELVSPIQGAATRGRTAKLVWQPVEGAEGYLVQVSPQQDYRDLIVDARISAGTALTVEQLDFDGTLFWRVATIASGGTGAWSTGGEFHHSSELAGHPYVGRTPEAGVETAEENAAEEEGPEAARASRFHSGSTEFYVFVAAIIISLVAAAVAAIVFPGLPGLTPEQAVARDSTRQALLAQQDTMAARLHRFTMRDSVTYTIPIDTAIAEIARTARAPGDARVLLPQ